MTVRELVEALCDIEDSSSSAKDKDVIVDVEGFHFDDFPDVVAVEDSSEDCVTLKARVFRE